MIDYENRSYVTVIDIKDKNKVQKLLDIIPQDVETIIDVGCGNGYITNELGKYYRVLGVDINESKLKFVETEKLKSSCNQIDKPDHSFDLVFSSEMLEHLEDDLYESTLAEFNRLSKKYILITTPYREPLHKLTVQCESCGKNYNKNGHLRRFSRTSLLNLHRNWKVVKSEAFGKKVRNYRKALADLKHQLTPPSAWIPNYWIKNQGVKYNYCIHCGHKNRLEYKFNLLAFLIDILNMITTRKRKSHLLGLFEKRNP